MTPRARLLTRAVEIIRAASNADSFATAATRADLMQLGALFVDGKVNTMKLGGVMAALDFDNGEQLILRWAANARAALAENDPDAATGCADDRSPLGRAIGTTFANEEEE